MGQPLAMQMSVCHRHPVIMLYLCPMPFRRKPSGGRLVSCSLTAHWLHRPGRLLEARVMKADIVSCLGAKAHGYVLRPRQGVGLRGIPFPQNSASGFGPLLLHPVSRACSSFRWPQFTASSIGFPSRLQSLSFIPMAAFHGLVYRSSIPLPEPVLHSDGRNSWPCPASRLLPCAVFPLFPHPFIPNDAVRCIGHRSALHWASQRGALAVAAHCVLRPAVGQDGGEWCGESG